MDILKQTLVEIGLPNLFQKFLDEKIEPQMIEELTDTELKRLGIVTIGDRHRLKEYLKHKLSKKDTNNNSEINSIAEEIERDGNLVFGNFVSRNSRKRSKVTEKKTKKSRGWTVKFVCLASKYSQKVPTAAEKEVLSSAGLGTKKIKLDIEDTEVDVMQKIMSDEIMEDSETVGFPQLKECGGFELLRSAQNYRQLDVINCRNWSVKELKANIGRQATVYIRPIQKNLSTKPIENKSEPVLMKVNCTGCGNQFTLRDLRKHTALCEGAFLMESDSDSDVSLPPVSDTQDENVLVVPSFSSTPAVQLYDEHGNALGSAPILNQISTTIPAAETFITVGTPEHVLTRPEISVTVEEPLSQDPIIQDESSLRQGADMPVITEVINYCKENNLTDPVEILKKCQNDICYGRALEIEDTTNCDEGDTNFILVNRESILDTGLDEVKEITDPRKTLEVQFYDEVIVNYMFCISKILLPARHLNFIPIGCYFK